MLTLLRLKLSKFYDLWSQLSWPHFDILFCLNVSLGSVSGYDLHWRATREDKWPNLALGLPAREFHREIQKRLRNKKNVSKGPIFWLWPALAGRHVKTKGLIWHWGSRWEKYILKFTTNTFRKFDTNTGVWLWLTLAGWHVKTNGLIWHWGSQPERISHLLYSSHLYIFPAKYISNVYQIYNKIRSLGALRGPNSR